MCVRSDHDLNPQNIGEKTELLAGSRSIMDASNGMVQVAAAFAALGTGTVSEVLFAAELDKGNTWQTVQGFVRAASDLQTMGLLRVVDRRPCEVTGRTARVLAWNPQGDDIERPIHIELSGTAVELLDVEPALVIEAIKAEATRQRAHQARLRARREEILAVVEMPHHASRAA
jgi:hypothetical protein